MSDLYSKRDLTLPDTFHYHFDERSRRRLLHTITQIFAKTQPKFESLLADVGNLLQREYGWLHTPTYEAARVSNDPVIEHFFRASDEEVIDFLQLCFKSKFYCAEARGVTEVNRIMLEHGIGYEFTAWVDRDTSLLRKLLAGEPSKPLFPQPLRKDNQLVHEQVVKPALQLLADPRFVTANEEMLRAYEHQRHGRLQEAITLCGSACESVLKTICHAKGWSFEPKATLAPMVGVCRENGLFPAFYENAFVSVATIRNSLSSAHGRGGANPPPIVRQEHVEHMLHLAAANILFWCRLANL